jgi:hypothetical protein
MVLGGEHLMIQILLASILILSSVFCCDTDKKLSLEKSDSYPLKKETSKVDEKQQKLLGDALFDHPGYSRKTMSEHRIPNASSVTINNYLCEFKESDDGKKKCMTFSRNGRKVRSDCSENGSCSIIMSPPAGKDINGDGIPNVIIECYSGGLHCCSQYAVFSLGKKLKLLAVLNGDHSHMEFKDIDGDGKYEVIGRDWAFAYWPTSFAGSPAPEVILRWNNGKYRLAENMMKKPPPGEKELQEMASGIEEGETYRILSAIMLKLIYTGNGNIALQYCDWFWQNLDKEIPRQNLLKRKKEFLAEFKKQLRKSYYWADLKKMNGW